MVVPGNPTGGRLECCSPTGGRVDRRGDLVSFPARGHHWCRRTLRLIKTATTIDWCWFPQTARLTRIYSVRRNSERDVWPCRWLPFESIVWIRAASSSVISLATLTDIVAFTRRVDDGRVGRASITVPAVPPSARYEASQLRLGPWLTLKRRTWMS